MNLKGFVLNSLQGVFIEVEGTKEQLDGFVLRIEKDKPALAFISSIEFTYLDPVGFKEFEIRRSADGGKSITLVMPDIATCRQCLCDVFEPDNRRYLYPFTNCTNCGPRFSIIQSLPYDRANTTMKIFEMCKDCRKEYTDPADRRFHAQPNACPECGPHLELWDIDGKNIAAHHQALSDAAEAIRSGLIVAVKGLGGFHLVADAKNENAVSRLREKKHREEKPFALMYHSIEAITQDCEVSGYEKRVLQSPETPIVILRKKLLSPSAVSAAVAPENPYLGVMLPYTPLHHILMHMLGFPVVATSGNLSDEPICTDENEAIDRLRNVADLFLVHNRPIERHVDDSIVRVILGRELVIRRARGYAPLPVEIDSDDSQTQLAVGAHLKNSIALRSGKNIFISQHIGDLETKESSEAFHNVIECFKTLYQTEPGVIISDLHPGYLSTQYADKQEKEIIKVQHHFAHLASCIAENNIRDRVLGVTWDGTGMGPDGTIWGGEFILSDNGFFRRIASFRKFKLPGGEHAIREPRRAALGVLYELFGDDFILQKNLPTLKACTADEIKLFHKMLAQNINSPVTSSAGRLFDALTSIIGLRQIASFEGQAAMELEYALRDGQTGEIYDFLIAEAPPNESRVENHQPGTIIDWGPMIKNVINDVKNNVDKSIISAKFHVTMTEMIINIASRAAVKCVALTGGCFQNKFLTEHTVQQLEARGFRPYWHQRVPPNDGGISLGQIAYALRFHHK